MKFLIGAVQFFAALAFGTWTYSENQGGGYLLHVFFAFIYTYWIKLGIFKAKPYVQRAVRGFMRHGSTESAVVTSESISKFGDGLAVLLVALLPIAGLGIVGLQLYAWLRTGVWLTFSVVDGLKLMFDYQWLANPVDWKGLHSALSNAPLSVLLVIGGGLLLVIILNEVDGIFK